MRILSVVVVLVFTLSSALLNAAHFHKQETKIGQSTKKGLPIGQADFYHQLQNLVARNDALELAGFLNKSREHIDVEKSLNQCKHNRIPILHWALQHKFGFEVFEILLTYGANPNLPICANFRFHYKQLPTLYKGYTAAHIAVKAGLYEQTLRLLRAYGTNFLLEDDDGWTPLQIGKAKARSRPYRALQTLKFIVEFQEDNLKRRDQVLQ